MTTTQLPAGRFAGVETMPLPGVDVESRPVAKPAGPPAEPRSVEWGSCPGGAHRAGRIEVGEHWQIRAHVHPVTHVLCSGSGRIVCQVWPSEQHARGDRGKRCAHAVVRR